MENPFMRALHMAHPIIQAPLAGGGDTPALVAAVSEAGGLGFIGAAYLSPQAIAETARSVRERTRRPYGINLFAPLPVPEADDGGRALERVAPFYEELGLPPPTRPQVRQLPFDAQLEAALDCGASIFSFTFGRLEPGVVARIKRHGMLVMGTATNVDEAVALERSGVDAVVVQGSEAGGHRGTFLGDAASGMIGTMALVPQTVDAIALPVVASGGIMDGRGIAAALALGASAVQMGTAFLTCEEAGVPDAYKARIMAAKPHETRITRAFSGRYARGIANRFMDEIDRQPDSILPFPLQNALTQPMRAAAAKQGQSELLSLWAGQGLGLARRETASALMERLVAETEAAIRRIAKS